MLILVNVDISETLVYCEKIKEKYYFRFKIDQN